MRRNAAEHARRFKGRHVSVTSPQGRFVEGAALLDGRRLERTDAYGKHLFLHFAGDRMLHVHLGLFGSVDLRRRPRPGPARRRAGAAGRRRLVRRPARRHRRRGLDGPRKSELLERLGPDPLRRDAKPDRAWAPDLAQPGADRHRC